MHVVHMNPAEAGRPNDVELEGLARGVAYRGIYARAALDAGPGVIKAIARYVAAGEEARIINYLPMKLATIDDELGLLPLDVDQDDVSRCFIIRPCSLLTAGDGSTTWLSAARPIRMSSPRRGKRRPGSRPSTTISIGSTSAVPCRSGRSGIVFSGGGVSAIRWPAVCAPPTRAGVELAQTRSRMMPRRERC